MCLSQLPPPCTRPAPPGVCPGRAMAPGVTAPGALQPDPHLSGARTQGSAHPTGTPGFSSPDRGSLQNRVPARSVADHQTCLDQYKPVLRTAGTGPCPPQPIGQCVCSSSGHRHANTHQWQQEHPNPLPCHTAAGSVCAFTCMCVCTRVPTHTRGTHPSLFLW